MTVKIEGAKELRRMLKLLPTRVQTKVMRSATLKGANVVRKDARRRAPVRQISKKNPRAAKKTGIGAGVVFIRWPGNLRKSIVSRRNRKVPRWAISYHVGFTGKAYYGLFIEKGTSHQPAQPFLRPAYEANKASAVQRIGESIREGLFKEIKKLRK
jgi:HK97 gp10 family phage protein